MTVHVTSARIKAIAHATEDPHKIVRAFHRLYPDENFEPRIEKAVVKGHFGNPITSLTAAIRGLQAERFFFNLWNTLSSSDREILFGEVGSRLDEQGVLHLRLDKQGCLLGTIVLNDQDPVKVEVSFRSVLNSEEEIRALLRSTKELRSDRVRC